MTHTDNKLCLFRSLIGTGGALRLSAIMARRKSLASHVTTHILFGLGRG
jgi:hypothetical protein